MSFKTLEEKVIFLDKLVEGTICVTHYAEWELSSFALNSLFCFDGVIGYVFGKTLTECIDKAIRLVVKEIGYG